MWLFPGFKGLTESFLNGIFRRSGGGVGVRQVHMVKVCICMKHITVIMLWQGVGELT